MGSVLVAFWLCLCCLWGSLAWSAVTINLKYSDKYVFAENGGGGRVLGTATSVTTEAKFTLIDAQCLNSGDQISLKSSGGKYLTAKNGGGDVVEATSSSYATNEKFTINKSGGGMINSGDTVTLKANGGQNLCVETSGDKRLMANCTSGSFTITINGLTPLTGTLGVGPSGIAKNDSSVNLSAKNVSGGPGGFYKYQYIVYDAATQAMVKDSSVIDSYSWVWNDKVNPGTYKLRLITYQYCNNVSVGGSSLSDVDGYKIAKITIGNPGTIPQGVSGVISWSSVNLTGNVAVDFWNGNTRTSISSSVNVADGRVTWSVPSNLAATSTGRIVISHSSNPSGLQWSRDNIVIGSGSDTTPPTTSLTAPGANTSVSGTVEIKADASDTGGSVARVEFYVDGTELPNSDDASSPYSYSWNTTQFSNASHSLMSKAFDAANNSASSTTISVTVNNPTSVDGKFTDALAEKFKHARCINCHGFTSANATQSAHANRSPDCMSCHTSTLTGASDWHGPPSSFAWDASSTTRSICQKIISDSRFDTPSEMRTHLETDKLILWAVDNAKVPKLDSSGNPISGQSTQLDKVMTKSDWLALIDLWLDAWASARSSDSSYNPCP